MKISDFERVGKGTSTRLTTRVRDASGEEEFELTFAGPEALVEEMFAEAEIEVTIDSRKTEDQWKEEVVKGQEDQRKAAWNLAALDDLDELFKPEPGGPQRDTTVFAAIRPVKGEGTPFFFSLSGFAVPGGASLFFFGSLVTGARGTVIPATGDQDLFMTLFSTGGPLLSRSTFGGITPDFVFWTFALVPFLPPIPFVPVFRILGFSAGVCANFSASGI